MNRPTDETKRLYKVWWGFLHNSDRYREFCEIMDQVMNDPEYSDETRFDQFEKTYAKQCKKQGKPYAGTDYDDPWRLDGYWHLFGNIYKSKFEDWWERKKEIILYSHAQSVIDLSDPEPDQLPFGFVASYNWKYKLHKGEKVKYPTIKEMLELLTTDKNYICVAIPIEGAMKEKLGELSQIRDKHLAAYKENRKKRKLSPQIEGKIYIGELENYLEVFSLYKQGLDLEEIIAFKEGDRLRKNPKFKSLYKDDLRRARNIMKNVEMCRFPGQYQPR